MKKCFIFLLLSFFTYTFADTKVFVITAHVRQENQAELWKRCYHSIRQFYPDDPIVIIDDNSVFPITETFFDNTTLMQSDYPGAAELLPYYYFLKYKWADKMIYLHDSMFLRRAFTPNELRHPIKFHWHFKYHGNDDNKQIHRLLKHLKHAKELKKLQRSGHSWYGCYAIASIIDLKALKKIEKKYSFTESLISVIKNRDQRMALERVFALLVFNDDLVEKSKCSNFGEIAKYPGCFTDIDSNLLEELKANYPGAILKTWHGR